MTSPTSASLTCALPAVPLQLPHQLDDVVHARHVRLGQQAAVRVDRQLAAEPDGAALDEGAALALLAEAEILQLAHHDVGEAIVDLGDVDVVRRDAGHRERLGRGLGDAEPRHVGSLGDDARRIRMAFGDAHHEAPACGADPWPAPWR